MKVFNSFQIVSAFIAWPYLVNFLSDATFRGAGVAFYSACAVYVVAFIAMIACVWNTIDTKGV